ncbi:MAG: hypothetical protein K8I60_18490, partial [Anaerolineae bacterium]|nr:hypothetical protein [Anaerolineae bacterium]
GLYPGVLGERVIHPDPSLRLPVIPARFKIAEVANFRDAHIIQRQGQAFTITRWSAEGGGNWSLPLAAGTDQVILVVAPFAPYTTVPMPYTVRVGGS